MKKVSLLLACLTVLLQFGIGCGKKVVDRTEARFDPYIRDFTNSMDAASESLKRVKDGASAKSAATKVKVHTAQILQLSDYVKMVEMLNEKDDGDPMADLVPVKQALKRYVQEIRDLVRRAIANKISSGPRKELVVTLLDYTEAVEDFIEALAPEFGRAEDPLAEDVHQVMHILKGVRR